MSAKKNILLTFDYELFQGQRSGTVANCMIIPTSRLLNILDRFNAKAIFFVDMLCVYRIEELADKFPKLKADFNAIKQQIIEIADRGHYVFNHLHPHWLDAKYNEEENQWDLSETQKYSFLALSSMERDLVFERTMNLLKSILKESALNPPPIGFRAGGLYIQPFSIFQKYFDRYGLKYDFSVLLGAKGQLEDNSNEFDFLAIEKNNYRFSNEVAVEDTKGNFYEYALKPLEIPLFYRLGNSFIYRLFALKRNHQRYGDGTPSANKIIISRKKLGATIETYSVEMMTNINLPKYLSEVKRNYYLHFLSHPKLISEYNLDIFAQFLHKVTANGETEFDFDKFKLN